MASGIGELLALIPARGGSKGLRNKNILFCDGRPLIAHTIGAALGAGSIIRRVVVSTDDQAIAEVSRQEGAEVPFLRPDELATDTTGSIDVARHALDWLEREEGWCPDWLMLLQPTSPLRTAKDILRAVEIAALDPSADSVISVVDLERYHPRYARKLVDGALQPYLAEHAPDRRQDLDPVFGNNGAIYLTRTQTIRDDANFYGSRSLPYVMPPDRSIDIDSELDLRLASFLLGAARTHERS